MLTAISVFLLGLGVFAIVVVDVSSGITYSFSWGILLIPFATCLGIVALRKMPFQYSICYSTLIFILNEVLLLIIAKDQLGGEGHGFLFVSLMAGLLLSTLCLLVFAAIKYRRERQWLWINLGLILLYALLNPAVCLALMKGNLAELET